MRQKIAVVGCGYVGLSIAILLAQKNEVVALDISPEKVAMINARRSPVADGDIQLLLKNSHLNLRATCAIEEAYAHAQVVIVAAPTDYDHATNRFDTKSVESIIRDVLSVNSETLIVIKSTVPIGFTEEMRVNFGSHNIVFSPEFLREGQALYDCLHPSRIIVGEKSVRARRFAALLEQGAAKRNVPVLLTHSREAEAIKLFANAYLAMRVAYFNELDTYALSHQLDTEEIVHGVCLDERVGTYYNNPSFGYGGYCLPKDTQQLLAHFEDTPNALVRAIGNSNRIRKTFIAEQIIARHAGVVGIYRLNMKTNSDNFRASSVSDIIDLLKARGIQIIVHEPSCKQAEYQDCRVVNDMAEFKRESDLIVANRVSPALRDVRHKVFSRDLFGKD